MMLTYLKTFQHSGYLCFILRSVSCPNQKVTLQGWSAGNPIWKTSLHQGVPGALLLSIAQSIQAALLIIIIDPLVLSVAFYNLDVETGSYL